jgi:hypothetical protein
VINASVQLAKGQIASQGMAGSQQASYNAAVTGGTGAYQNARGWVHVEFTDNGVVFTSHLIP